MRVFKFAAVAAALTLAGAAHAQGTALAPAPAPAPVTGPPAGADFYSNNERGREFDRLNDEVAGRRAGPTRSSRPVPVHPDDVTVGSEVRDSKGVVIGTIESVGVSFAVAGSKSSSNRSPRTTRGC